MKTQKLIVFLFIAVATVNFAQNTNTYKPERDKIHNLVHTKLKVGFNFSEKQLNGEAWITAKPHFYATNKITLSRFSKF